MLKVLEGPPIFFLVPGLNIFLDLSTAEFGVRYPLVWKQKKENNIIIITNSNHKIIIFILDGFYIAHCKGYMVTFQL